MHRSIRQSTSIVGPTDKVRAKLLARSVFSVRWHTERCASDSGRCRSYIAIRKGHVTTKRGRNGRQNWQSDSQTWQQNVAETAKCGRLAEKRKQAGR